MNKFFKLRWSHFDFVTLAILLFLGIKYDVLYLLLWFPCIIFSGVVIGKMKSEGEDII